MTCCKCGRELAPTELAWARDWLVLEGEGVRREIRYTCDGCEGE